MRPIKTRACGLGLILLGVVSFAAHADTPTPSSLHMRASVAKPARWSPMRWAKRVAQVAPADDPAPTTPDSSTQPADSQPAPAPAAPAADPAGAPEPAPAAEPAAPPAGAPAAYAPPAPAAAPAAA